MTQYLCVGEGPILVCNVFKVYDLPQKLLRACAGADADSSAIFV
jgi:hypothetical protein